MENNQLLSIGKSTDVPSGIRLTFDQLTVDVQKATDELSFLMEQLPRAAAQYRQSVIPLYETLRTVRKNFLLELEEWLLEGALNRQQKNRITEYLLVQIPKYGGADEDLKAMFNRYCDEMPQKQTKAQSDNIVIDFVEDLPEKTTLEEEPAPWEKASAEHRNNRRNRKKLEQAQQLKRSVKTVYTGLMKVFHPDKETDPDRKAEKEEISKQITVAYGNQDFMGLLKLESEFLTSQKQRLGLLNETQIRQYIEVLKEQKTELHKQLEQLKSDYGFLFDVAAMRSEKPLQQLIKSEKSTIESAIQGYRTRIRILKEADGAELKKLWSVLEEETNEREEEIE